MRQYFFCGEDIGTFTYAVAELGYGEKAMPGDIAANLEYLFQEPKSIGRNGTKNFITDRSMVLKGHKRGSLVVLTEGRESSGIIRFAIPLFIGNLFQQMYTVVDSVIIGQGVGKAAFAALGNSANILWLFNSLAIGLGMGTTIILSQYYGAEDQTKLKQTVDTGAVFLLAMAAVLSTAGALLVGPILRVMKVPADVYPYARLYLMIMILGMVFTFTYNAIGAVLRGIGDSRHPLYFLIVAAVANIILDIVFVLFFGWGVAGAAAATLVSQALSVAVGLWYIYRRSGHDFLHIRPRRLCLSRHVFGKTMTVGLPFGIQQALVALGYVVYTRIVNPFGTDTIAGYTAGSRLEAFAILPAMSFGMAIATFTGQNLGAGKEDRIRRGFHFTLLTSGGIAVLVSILLLVFRSPMIRLFNTEPGVVAMGGEYLRWVAPFYILFSTMYIVTGVLRGAGATLEVMLFTLVSQWLVRIPLSLWLSSLWGTHGIWISIPISWAMSICMSGGYYLSGKWKKRGVVRQGMRNLDMESPQKG